MADALLITHLSMDLSSHGISTLRWSPGQDPLWEKAPTALFLHLTPDTLPFCLQRMAGTTASSDKEISMIVLHEGLESQNLKEFFAHWQPLGLLPFATDLAWDELLNRCFSHFYHRQQSQELVRLVSAKNEELRRLTISLEDKIRERQEQLEISRQKNLLAQSQTEALRKALMQIYGSRGIREMEHGLSAMLKKEFNLSMVQIRSAGQSSLQEDQKLKIFKTPLKSGQESFGNLLFIREGSQRFDSREKKFFTQVADAVALALQRNYQYDRSQELRRQWEATFDAISDPICLTDVDYNILRVNDSFARRAGLQAKTSILGETCYRTLFKRDQPCLGCQRGTTYRIQAYTPQRPPEIFEVISRKLGTSTFFQMYRDITQDLNLQRQVIESAKLAELGTISSSIAHELNNPIGGMLNFLQLMKMDLSGEEDYYSDLVEIEKGIIKCKEIVKNLLGFSRRSVDAQSTKVDLVEVIEQAIKITELKTRSIGITIQFQKPDHSPQIQGRFNLLTHAIRNLLQNSQESLLEQRRKNRSFRGEIRISLRETTETIEVDVSDNGPGIPPPHRAKIFDPLYTTKDPETNSGLGLTLAQQIVREHNGEILLSSDNEENLTFRVCLNKPQVQS